MMTLLPSLLRPAWRPEKSKRYLSALACAGALVPCSLHAGVLKIELPPETRSFKPGPGAELANGQCLVCHSVDYVVMQPQMPRAFWAASVKKMREKFGAQIPDDQVEPLVSYLEGTYGLEANAATNTVAPAVAVVGNPASGSMTGEALATRYGCLLCHGVNKKIVGPAYQDVAAKYHNDGTAVTKITEQIHKGGSGKWGPVIMPPFPMITDAETKVLADWILSRK